MATPTLTPASVTIPAGGTADVTVTWTLDPGTPDSSGTLQLVQDGTVIATVPTVKPGTPAEQAPALVTASPAPGSVLVTCDVAAVQIVAQGNPGTIRLS